jgi:hypothetical protein
MAKPSSAQTDTATRIVELLDEIAKLMKDAPAIDQKALEYLMQLQTRIRFLSFGDHSIGLPTKPPIKWIDREDRTETPLDFIRREYKEWLGKGLSRPYIRRLDKNLYAALTNWISQNGKLPEDIELPTKKEMNDRRLEEIGYRSKGPSSEQREALRLYQAARRRAKR